MLVFTMILISALEIIDATIVSIALPMMQSSLSANSEEIGWTVTAYLIATSIVLPLTGFIVTHLGRRNTLIVCTVGFGVTSMLCGFSVSLTMMILFRTLQGLFGALFAPLAQAILADHFPKASLNHAMSWYGMGIVVIPLFGPLLGSYLTEYLSWRWIFYMNVPICLLALSLIAVVISDNEQTSKTTPSVDWIGLLLMAICIGTAQFVLEQGNNLDWLNSKLIQVMLVGSTLTVIVFMLRGFCLGKKNIIDFAIFRDRNFVLSMIIMACFRFCFNAILIWLPTLMFSFMGYPLTFIGQIMVVRGIVAMVMMRLMPYLCRYIPRHFLLALSLLGYAYIAWLLSLINLNIAPSHFVWINVMQGISMSLFFVPISTLTYVTLDPAYRSAAAGFVNFARSFGGSVGIAVFAAVLTQQQQMYWHLASGFTTTANPALSSWLMPADIAQHNTQGLAFLYKLIGQFVHSHAYANTYLMLAVICLLLIPLVFVVGRVKSKC